MWLGLVAVLPLLWKGATCKVRTAPCYDMRVSSNVGVQEGLCVTIPCIFIAGSRKAFSKSSGYWIRGQGPVTPFYIVASNDKSRDVKTTNFHLTGNPDNGDCTLTITDARKEDEGPYYYRFEESNGKKVKYNYHDIAKTTITVTALTEEPVISDPGTMIAGINKTLTCAPPGNCPATSLTFQWWKSNVADVWKKNSSTVTFTPSRNDHQENITCEMMNSKEKTTRKTILFDVYYPNGNVEIPAPSSADPTGNVEIPAPSSAVWTDKYQDIAIAFVCGMTLMALIFLLYKLITRKKMGKKKNNKRAEEASGSVEPPTSEKSGHKAKDATDNKTELDPSGVTSQDDLHYSTVAFSAKPSKVQSSPPETEYAEINKRR